MAERTNQWDAIGVGSYGLVVALFESAFVFLVALSLGFLLPKGWNEAKRIGFMGTLVLIISLWAILGQLYYLLDWSVPSDMIRTLAGTSHPLRMLYGVSLILAGVTVLVPVFGLMKSEKAVQVVKDFFERLTVLTSIYLLLDIAGLIVVIVRNL